MTFSQEEAIAQIAAMVKRIRINILSPLIAFSLNFIYKDFQIFLSAKGKVKVFPNEREANDI